MVLDEASSRLDPATEAALARATERLLEGRTAVVIAHRLATLERVDEIAVVDGGRIVEHGRRESLAADPSTRYAELLRHHADGFGLLADEVTSRERRPVIATARRLIGTDRQAWLIGLGYWILFHGWPLVTGLALKAVLDRLAGDSDVVAVDRAGGAGRRSRSGAGWSSSAPSCSGAAPGSASRPCRG